MCSYKVCDEKAKLSIGAKGEQIELDILKPSIGPKAIDVRKLYAQTGYFTYDPGFMATCSCTSDITYIDGAKGILQHRGYPIELVADKLSFVQLTHLLLEKTVPNEQETKEYDKKITSYFEVTKGEKSIISNFDKKDPAMAIASCVTGFLAAKHDRKNEKDLKKLKEEIIRAIAKEAAISCYINSYREGREFIEPSQDLNFIENFTRSLLFKTEDEYNNFEHKSLLLSSLNKLLCLHIDHEQNASTSSVRLVQSSGVNLYGALSAGIMSLWGPSHGGANEAVINMLEEIATPDRVEDFIAKAKDKEDSFKLMGFGHRVYKEYDPRAKVIKSACAEILDVFGTEETKDLLEIARKLEKAALEDEYFASRKLFPNVDFYSGVIYKALGLDNSFFTVMFMVARSAGWLTQLFEFSQDPERKIGRPRQLYVGDVDKTL